MIFIWNQRDGSVVKGIWCFGYNKPSLYSWHQFDLITYPNVFDRLLSSVCEHSFGTAASLFIRDIDVHSPSCVIKVADAFSYHKQPDALSFLSQYLRLVCGTDTTVWCREASG